MKKCPRCQAIKLEETIFLWSNNAKVDSTTQNTKVCRYVPQEYKHLCVNNNTAIDTSKQWETHNNLDVRTEKVLKGIVESGEFPFSNEDIESLKYNYPE